MPPLFTWAIIAIIGVWLSVKSVPTSLRDPESLVGILTTLGLTAVLAGVVGVIIEFAGEIL